MPSCVFLPGDAPVRFNLEDGGVVCVVELDLGVTQLGGIDVNHDRGVACGLACRRHPHYFPGVPSER